MKLPKRSQPRKNPGNPQNKRKTRPRRHVRNRPKYNEKTVTQHTLTEILAEAEYEENALKTLLKLLETLAKH
jgi:hypothetical protein